VLAQGQSVTIFLYFIAPLRVDTLAFIQSRRKKTRLDKKPARKFILPAFAFYATCRGFFTLCEAEKGTETEKGTEVIFRPAGRLVADVSVDGAYIPVLFAGQRRAPRPGRQTGARVARSPGAEFSSGSGSAGLTPSIPVAARAIGQGESRFGFESDL
jgi:hypothetical protein